MQPTFRPKENVNAWNIFFSVLFAALLFFSLSVLMQARGGVFPRAVSLIDMVLMALAVFRITRLIVYDKITRWLRELFIYKRDVIADDGTLWVELIPYGRGIRHTIHDLMQCPWCVGVWAALVVVFGYFAFSWAWYIIFMLAVAAVASFLQVIANHIGWRAENAKLDAKAKNPDVWH